MASINTQVTKLLAEEIVKAIKTYVSQNSTLSGYFSTAGTTSGIIGVVGGGGGGGSIGSVNADSVTGLSDWVANYISEVQSNAAQGNENAVKILNVLTDIAYANIGTATINTAQIKDLYASYGEFINLVANSIKVGDAEIDNLDVEQLQADIADISFANVDKLKAEIASIDTAFISTAQIEDLNAVKVQSILSESDTAWINESMIKNASISDAMIIGVSANKLMAGEIDASKITVSNLNASSINTGKLTVGGLTIDIENSETKLDGSSIENGTITLSGLSDEVKSQIIDSIEIWTTNVVPTLNNYPASEWETNADKKQHVGDICYVVSEVSPQNGFCYRFIGEENNTFYWTLIKDSDITAALSKLQNAEEKIGSLESFKTETTNWKKDIDGGIEELTSRTTTIETTYATKDYVTDPNGEVVQANVNAIINKTEFNDKINTVVENSSTITTIKEEIETANETIKTNTQTINSVQQTVNSNSSTIKEMQDSDAEFKQQYSEFTQTLGGFKADVGNTYATKVGDNSDLAVAQKAAVEMSAENIKSALVAGSLQTTYTQTAEGFTWTVPTIANDTNCIDFSNGAFTIGKKTNGVFSDYKVQMTSTGLDIINNNNVSVANYGENVRIGRSNNQRILLNSNSLQGYDSSNKKYFEINKDGVYVGEDLNTKLATESEVDAASNTANSYMEYTDGVLTIGNKTSGSFVGYRTQLSSDEMNIVDEKGKSFAKYGTDTRIGASDKEHINIKSDSLEAYDSNGSKYFSVNKDGLSFGTTSAATQSYVDNSMSNTMKFADGKLTIGDNRTGSFVGYRTQVSSDGMEIIDGNGNSVASYKDETRLGKDNSSRFVIKESSVEAYDNDNNQYLSISRDGISYGDISVASEDELNNVNNSIRNDVSNLIRLDGDGISVGKNIGFDNRSVHISSEDIQIKKGETKLAIFDENSVRFPEGKAEFQRNGLKIGNFKIIVDERGMSFKYIGG